MKDIILSAGGYDPTAGAGILLDSYVFSRFNQDSRYIVTSLVIQTPFEVLQNIVLEDTVIKKQIEALAPFYKFTLINIGLIDFKLIEYIKNSFKNSKIIYDPIMASGSGKHTFLSENKIDCLLKSIQELYLITPNVPEAEKLSGEKIKNINDMIRCVKQIKSKTGVRNVLLKGGHLEKGGCDVLFEEDGSITKYRVEKAGFRIHGTGSFLNAGIIVGLAKGKKLPDAVSFAKTNLNSAASRVSSDDPILRMEF